MVCKNNNNLIDFLDIETVINNNTHIPICIIFTDNFDVIKYYGLDCIEKFLSYQKANKTYHIQNINFDILFIMKIYIKNYTITEDCIKFLWLDSEIYWVKLYINNFWIEFKCTYKILRLSLKALGESIQKPKIPAPYSLFTMQTFLSDNLSVKESDFDLKEDYLNFIKQFGSPYSFKKFILEYCNHDINILLNTYPKILEILTKNLVVGNFYSASTLAFNIFIKNFNNFKIKFGLIKAIINNIKL